MPRSSSRKGVMPTHGCLLPCASRLQLQDEVSPTPTLVPASPPGGGEGGVMPPSFTPPSAAAACRRAPPASLCPRPLSRSRACLRSSSMRGPDLRLPRIRLLATACLPLASPEGGRAHTSTLRGDHAMPLLQEGGHASRLRPQEKVPPTPPFVPASPPNGGKRGAMPPLFTPPPETLPAAPCHLVLAYPGEAYPRLLSRKGPVHRFLFTRDPTHASRCLPPCGSCLTL